MSRTPSFDLDEVVRAARDLFWTTGYEDASIPDLERATGLSRSSIYNVFHSKRGLFDAAVQSYLTEIVRPLLRPLQKDAVDPEALVSYLRTLRAAFRRFESMPAQNGCMLINASGAPVSRSDDVAAVITGYHAELRQAIGEGVRARHPRRSARAQEELADIVTALVVSAFALARVDARLAAKNMETAIAAVEAAR